MTARILGVLSACALLAVAVPAHAGTQEDIQTCRDALTVKGEIDMAEYRLSFKKKKGNSTRTLTMEAIPNGEGQKYLVSCTLSKSAVTEISLEAV
jgi:hypothetical protein